MYLLLANFVSGCGSVALKAGGRRGFGFVVSRTDLFPDPGPYLYPCRGLRSLALCPCLCLCLGRDHWPHIGLSNRAS